MPPRPRVEPTDDWRQIALLAQAPGQRTYELIRPVVLFGQSPAERAAVTGAVAAYRNAGAGPLVLLVATLRPAGAGAATPAPEPGA